MPRWFDDDYEETRVGDDGWCQEHDTRDDMLSPTTKRIGDIIVAVAALFGALLGVAGLGLVIWGIVQLIQDWLS